MGLFSFFNNLLGSGTVSWERDSSGNLNQTSSSGPAPYKTTFGIDPTQGVGDRLNVGGFSSLIDNVLAGTGQAINDAGTSLYNAGSFLWGGTDSKFISPNPFTSARDLGTTTFTYGARNKSSNPVVSATIPPPTTEDAAATGSTPTTPVVPGTATGTATYTAGTPTSGIDPAQAGIGNQNPNRAGAPVIGSDGTMSGISTGESTPTFDFDLNEDGVISADDLALASSSPNALAQLLGTLFEDVQSGQQNLMDVRTGLPTNVSDLESARTTEGVTDALSALRDVNARIANLNATVANIEDDVRTAMPEATESFVQAEIERRMRGIRPQMNRLLQEQQNAATVLELARQQSTERFSAMRADAGELLARAQQSLDFKVENADTAFNLLTGMKQYEILVDSQFSARRDAARAVVATLLATPRGLSALTDQDLAEMAVESDIPYNALIDIRDNIKTGLTPLQYNIDDAGNLNVLFASPFDGSFSTQRYDGFATIVGDKDGISADQLRLYQSLAFLSTNASNEFARIMGEMYAAAEDGATLDELRQIAVRGAAAMGTASQIDAAAGDTVAAIAAEAAAAFFKNNFITATEADTLVEQLGQVQAAQESGLLTR